MTALLLLTPLASLLPARAQAQCGEVTSIRFPVDPAAFDIAQGYGARSQRHDGRYHTGEDWYGGRGTSLGQPVHAIANGRVTYSAPTGWGRDGGVLIVEHTFPDASVAYSVYGHMAETDAVQFPAPFTCVREGDVIGVVGDIRPAPHLHFEIKVGNPNNPGVGYSWEEPFAAGWRQPGKFVLNWQAWLLPAHRWHADIADESGPATPPIELPDHSLIYLDRGRVARLSPDGRILWRIVLEQPAVGLLPSASGDSAAIVFASGQVQSIALDGGLGGAWALGVQPDSAPIPIHNLYGFRTVDNRLVAVDPVQQAIVWSLDDVPPIDRAYASANLIGLVTRGETGTELLVVSPSGALMDRAQLRDGAALAGAGSGGLLVSTQNGVWTVGPDGAWTAAVEAGPASTSARGVLQAGDGRIFAFDGATLRAYDPRGGLLWETALPGVTGTTSLDLYGSTLLLSGTSGHLIIVRADTGGVCNVARVYGDRRSNAWHSLGDDGILRVAVSDQILGLDWRRFLSACA